MVRDGLLFEHSRAEQIMGMSAPVQHWTADRVRALIDESRPWPRYEFVDGALLVTPAPRPVHQAAVGELHRRLADFIDRVQLAAAVFVSPADLELVSDTIVQPDVFVAPLGPRETLPDWTLVHSLLLTIEIVSPSSAHHDRTAKRRFFTQVADVREYWVVDLEARLIERWMHGEDQSTMHNDRIDWTPLGAGETLTIQLPELFKRVWRE